MDDSTFVSNHFGDHPALTGKTISIPFLWDDPDDALRLKVHDIIRRFIRPRNYLIRKASDFFQKHMQGNYVIGVHARGTDAISKEEIRPHRKDSLVLSKYVKQIQRLLDERPMAKIFIATDAQSSLDYLREVFADRVIAYNSIRHTSGNAAGQGPTGWIMPAYISSDRDRAAQNGEEAIVEYLLLGQCNYLVHNGSGLARTVLLNIPQLCHANTHYRVPADRATAAVKLLAGKER